METHQFELAMDYRGRQQKLRDLIGDEAVFVQLSQPVARRNANTEHPYRQHSTMDYLTGFREQDSALVFAPGAEPGSQVSLFLRDKNAFEEMWSGRRLGVDAATHALPVDQAFAIGDLWDKLPDLMKDARKVYFQLGYNPANDRRFVDALLKHKAKYGRMAGQGLLPVFDSELAIGNLRLRKEPAEIERMKKAAAITKAAFDNVLKRLQPGMTEKQIYGILVGTFYELGADMESYGTIVAGGANACILHYVENNQPLKEGDVLLIDAGAQMDYYASDVTRTFPIGQKFTDPQKALYEACLKAQETALGLCKPGSSIPEIHDATIRSITESLVDLEIIKASVDEAIEKKIYREFFPHGTSHWIGKDVHDVGLYVENGEKVTFEPGMFFSVEPGIYVNETAEVDEQWKGIGIRIEDDALITENGCDILTESIPKAVEAIESR